MEFADTPDQPQVAGVSDAVDSVRTGVAHLIKLADDGGLNDFDTTGLVGLLREFQGVLNLLPVFDQALIQHCVERRVPDELCFRNMRAVLVSSLRVSPGEAGRRVKAADRFADRHSMLGETLPPQRPLTAEAQRAGGLNSEQARVIADALKPVTGTGFDPADVIVGEQILIDAARYTGPVDLKLLGQRIVEAIDPDGTLPDDDRQAGQRFFRMRQSAKDGSWSGEFRLTNLVGQKLRAVIDSLIRPVVTNCNVQPANTGPNSDHPGDQPGSVQTKAAGGGAAGAERPAANRAYTNQADRTEDGPDEDAEADAASGPAEVAEPSSSGPSDSGRSDSGSSDTSHDDADDASRDDAGGTRRAGADRADAGDYAQGCSGDGVDGAAEDVEGEAEDGVGDRAGIGNQTGARDGAQDQASGSRLPVEPDVRTFEQRQHDALEQVLDRILRSNTLPDSGGVPATIIVTIDEQNLVSGTGAGRFTDGSLVSTTTVTDLTSEAEIVRVHKTRAGAILNLGRTRRLASRNQTLALIARDGGCSFPNCTIQPEWCERHHIIEWQHGGRTDLDNLTLLCRYHHRYFQQRGWKCEINTDQLPAWTPPKWQDPNQTPILHPRIQTMNWKPNRS